LLEFVLRPRNDITLLPKDNRPRTCGPLIERDNEAHAFSKSP
jgi:hypothetical protein